jgi:hypothetical protein
VDIDDPSASRDWADAWVAAHAANDVRDDIEQFEVDHRSWFRESYGRGVDQFYVEFGALVKAVHALNFVDRHHWPAHRPMQYVIVSKNLKAFHSAMDRLSAGFDVDSIG